MASGTYVEIGGGARAFIPDPLPPQLSFDLPLVAALSDTDRAIGGLARLSSVLPNPQLLIQPFLRKEAIASSRIEGTRTDFGQLTLFEETEESAPMDNDLRETVNYLSALEAGLEAITYRSVSMSLLKGLHGLLMEGVRGADKRPGEVRAIQNFIGNRSDRIDQARYVPPPPYDVPNLLDDLDRYIREPDSTPSLIRLALAHYQFEAIHPFLDGNGRLGRLLVSLLLKAWDILPQPILYLSAYFEQNRDEYLDRLLRVSTHGDWVEWTIFFLTAVKVQANDAIQRSDQLLSLRSTLQESYAKEKTPTLLRSVDILFERPTLTTNRLRDELGLTYPAANSVVNRLISDGVLREITGRKRNRVFRATGVFDILERPLPSNPDSHESG